MKSISYSLLVCALTIGYSLLPAAATTIAWDGQEFACDSQRTKGTSKVYTTHKINFIKERNVYIGIAGESSGAERFLKEYKETGIVTAMMLDKIEVLIVDTDGKCIYYTEGSAGSVTIEGAMAIGSGEQFAMAAMTLGKSASQAIELAKQLDIFTGGTVHTYHPARVAVSPASPGCSYAPVTNMVLKP